MLLLAGTPPLVAAERSMAAAVPAVAPNHATTVLDAREAFRARDRLRLASLRAVASADRNPLAPWIDYWELTNRIRDAQPDEVNAFAARWSGSYVEDRLRNDWLLELGKRRDWTNFALEFPRFRMNDDGEVTCYALLVDHLAGKPVREAALDAWLADRDASDGCTQMSTTLYEARLLTTADAWRKARLAVEANRPKAARQAVGLVGPGAYAALGDVLDSPARYLARNASAKRREDAELATLALLRIAASDGDQAAGLLMDHWDRELPNELAGYAWAAAAKQSAIALRPTAADLYQRAARARRGDDPELALPDETLAWKVRAALRADKGRPRWQQVMQAIDAMSAGERKDAAWVYWKARAMIALSGDNEQGEAQRRLARALFLSIADQFNFYGQLAAEEAGSPQPLPARPEPPTPDERSATVGNPGLVRALQLIAIGLRSEGVREWNFTLRGMGDRELLAAAQLACDREVWDRCINTSDRTKREINMEQRFPTPFRRDVQAHSREIGLDPAYVYGLIRQESRFIMDARSGVGASGLMQLMPATARWTAKRIGVAFSPQQITDRDVNLRLGHAYLKLVLDDLGGSQALGAAAYNAGPGRPRRWREGATLEPAAWAENIPFNETRDYVKKVLSNATYYAALLGDPKPSLRERLGKPIGPAMPGARSDPDLP
ncbi:transglycosylase SLT domain-containing protein [Piscinibacter koreensis]|uniref:Transglycosylase SLT domain-containing protein n=1 Tax=Piscinibacter koreensis TaxID=2742824 RepID=A0A7Y6NNJ7_9BURK|nr:transglycosylase SLT domain-containing protein [Schlegelella koreensis]